MRAIELVSDERKTILSCIVGTVVMYTHLTVQVATGEARGVMAVGSRGKRLSWTIW